MSTPVLVRVLAIVVRFLVEWYRPVLILLHATPHVVPVFGVVEASFLLVDCLIYVVGTVLTTIEQRLSSLISVFVEHHIIGHATLLLTVTRNQKSRLRMWQ